MNDSQPTLLITGSGARFAAHLSDELAVHGWEVRTVLQSDPASVPHTHAVHVESPDDDMARLLEALDGASAVILLGGIGPVDSVVADVTALDAVLGHLRPGSTLISVTSLAVFGDAGPTPVTEASEPETPDEFATARACEQRVLAANDWLRGAVLRPGLVFGDDHGGQVVRAAVQQARDQGTVRFFGEATDIIPTVHERDLLDLVLRVLDDDTAHGLYHAVSGAVSVQGMTGLIAASAGTDRVEAWDAASMRDVFGEVVSVPRISVNADLARCRSSLELGWKPSGRSLRECVTEAG